MPTIIMSAELETSFESWVQNFDDHQPARAEVGIKDIYRGYVLNDPSQIRVVLWTPSMEVVESFMEEHAEHIKNSGHNLETTVVTVCSD